MTSYPSYGNPVWPAAMQPHYHGAHQPHHEGFCPACCHPMSQCCCGWRECRCESKELLASPGKRAAGDILKVPGRATEPESMAADIPPSMAAAFTGVAGLNQEAIQQLLEQRVTAFIGGGCCVHLSIECSTSRAGALVAAAVLDSENTLLAWAKAVREPGYFIKENIISTNPGAQVWLAVDNGIARLRWCEVFSC